MGRNWLVVFALVGALGLFTPAATAQGRGEGHGRGHHQDDDDQGWSREGRYETRAYRDRDDRPPGWSKGIPCSGLLHDAMPQLLIGSGLPRTIPVPVLRIVRISSTAWLPP